MERVLFKYEINEYISKYLMYTGGVSPIFFCAHYQTQDLHAFQSCHYMN